MAQSITRHIFMMTVVVPMSSAQAQTLVTDKQFSESKIYQLCITKASGVDFDMIDCSNAEKVRHDKSLNDIYAAKMKAGNDKFKSSLKSAQRAWISYRDTTCETESEMYLSEPGTADRLNQAECLLHATIEREKWLTRIDP